MSARDPHRFINELDTSTVGRLIDRLESRGRDRIFTKLTEKYLEELSLQSERVLEVGCGTGVVTRAVTAVPGFHGEVVGLDQSSAFIETARDIAKAKGLDHTYDIGDAHDMPYGDESFDVVLVHTVISHVTSPDRILNEIRRVLRKKGRAVFFDGDYASLTFGNPDLDQGRRMDWALACATFNNPVVMRTMPQALTKAQLTLASTAAHAVVEIGSASYFRSFADTYAPMVAESGLVPAETVDAWLADQHDAMDKHQFFASCNYFTVVAHR